MVSNYVVWTCGLSNEEPKQKQVEGSIRALLFDAWSDNWVGRITILKRKSISGSIRSEIIVSMDILNSKIKISHYASQKERKDIFDFLCDVCEASVDFFVSCEHCIV